MKVKMAICDDEIQQTQYIKLLVGKWADDKNITIAVDMFENGKNFKKAWSNNNNYDILLLDIQMDGQNGIELARELRETDEKLIVIFITGFADYMSEGYDVSALHYLMKPVKKDKLFEALNKAVKRLKKEPEILTFEINRENIIIPLRDVIYIESSLNYIVINTLKEQYKVKMSLKEIEDKLGGGFFKCTRSFIVGLRYVHIIIKKEIILTNGISIPLGRGLYEDINNAFIKYF